MKINVKALFQIGSIECSYKTTRPDGSENVSEARFAYVTDVTVKQARKLSVDNATFRPGTGDPDVSYGSAVAVSRDDAGKSEGHVIGPGEDQPFFLSVDGKDHRLSGQDMLKLRESIMACTKGGTPLNSNTKNALEGIQNIFEMIVSAPDIERFPVHLIAQAYQAAMIDHFGTFELPITPAGFAAKSRADLLRARIGILDPSHSDGIAQARPLRDLLSSAGIEVSISGVGVEVRSPAASQITEEAIRRTVLANDRMCGEVFGVMTSTPIEKLSAAMIPLSGIDILRTHKSKNKLSGDWVRKVSETACNITQGNMHGYNFELDVFSEGGRDMLVISDDVGQKNDIAFIYSWPTAERIPVMEIGLTRILNVSPEEVPTEIEIERLSQVLGHLESSHIYDPEGDPSHHT